MYKVLTINVFVIIIFYKDNKIHEYWKKRNHIELIIKSHIIPYTSRQYYSIILRSMSIIILHFFKNFNFVTIFCGE